MPANEKESSASGATHPLLQQDWRPAQSFVGLIIGLIGGYVYAGYVGSICGALLLGGLWPAARRNLAPDPLARVVVAIRLGLNRAAIGDPVFQAAASAIGELVALVAGGLIGLGVALLGRVDPLLLTLSGAIVLYAAGGGVGHYLARARRDARVPVDCRSYVYAYYALRAVGLLLGLVAGALVGAILRDALQVLAATGIGVVAGAFVAGMSCGVAGIVPPWEWRLLGDSRLKRWASRAYRAPARVVA